MSDEALLDLERRARDGLVDPMSGDATILSLERELRRRGRALPVFVVRAGRYDDTDTLLVTTSKALADRVAAEMKGLTAQDYNSLGGIEYAWTSVEEMPLRT